jgi:Flp pilus assembly protein TadG
MNALPSARRQRGAIVMLYAMVLIVVLGFGAFVVDLGLLYLRRVQLQSAADGIALAAAVRLDGTAAGVAAAVQAAKSRAATMPGGIAAAWSDDALRFAPSPDAAPAGWLASPDAAAAAASALYVRFDVTALAQPVNVVQPVLSAVLGVTELKTPAAAVAGPRTLRVTPLAICAMDEQETTWRDNPGRFDNGVMQAAIHEMLTFGFRYGVTYNLLKLNPQDPVTPQYYLVDPLVPPGTSATSATSSDAAVATFMCSGTLAYPRVGAAGMLNVRPLSSFNLAAQLNTRFGDTAAGCTAAGAPRDYNTRNYAGTGVTWQSPYNTASTPASAQSQTVGSKLATIADLPPGGATFPPAAYGTRWAFGAARGSATTAVTYGWATLYPSSPRANNSWSSPTPYHAASGTAPTSADPARRGRRILYVPLL